MLKQLIGLLSNSNYQGLVSAITAVATAFIAIISLIISIATFVWTRREYNNNNPPQLSMKLLEYNNILYLQIKNTGKIAAKAIKINLLSIENNGTANELMTGDLFKNQFELYPEETVQDMIALFGASLTNTAFPTVILEVSYCVGTKKKRISYRRTVTYISAYTEKISADFNVDLGNIESYLKGIARADIRTANYLDGCQVAPFDELNILAGKSFANDLHEVLGQKTSTIQTREETISKALSQRKAGNSNADT